ncbi:UNVERIFIED_CONTAM: hypothetical protein RMT77_005936 [Armadillidium vulgare]
MFISALICYLCLTLQTVEIRGSTDDIDESSNEYAITENVMLITNEIHDWMSQPEQDYGNMPFHIKQLVLTLNKTSTKGSHDDTDRIFSGTRSLCGPCEMLASVVVGYSRIGGSINILANFLSKICFLFIYKDSKVCRGLIYQDKDRLNYIIKNTNVDGAALCSLALGSQGCGPFKGPSWALHIPLPSTLGGHPQISYKFTTSSLKRHTRRYRRQTIHGEERSIDFSGPESQIVTTPGKKSYKKTLKVLHLTDPHFDPEYKVGSNAVCEAPLCCNEDSGRVKKVTDGAGIWGDYRNCDSPKWLIENMLQHISNNHPDIDYIMCTGDLVPHHIWRINPDSNVHVIRDVTDMILHYFPKTPVYGAIGNHEAYPRDSFPPPEVPEVFSKFGNQWLYDAVSETWERLQRQPLPSTARYAGYYSILIRPRFRLISINTNFCYILNWWVLYKPIDPGHVLNWLVKELQQAETNGELVHIIGHIPPLYVDCYDQWAHQFSRLVSRYAHIIRGQFYGHSHLDEFRIHYDVKDPRVPVGVEYITPNNGPFTNLNPSYRIYHVDGDHPETTRHILDYDTYVMNLTHANIFDDPQWYKLYSAKKDLELPDLLPASWDNFTKRLARDPGLFYKYYRYQMQDSDPALRNGCDRDCRSQTICTIVEGDLFLPRKCRKKD